MLATVNDIIFRRNLPWSMRWIAVLWCRANAGVNCNLSSVAAKLASLPIVFRKFWFGFPKVQLYDWQAIFVALVPVKALTGWSRSSRKPQLYLHTQISMQKYMKVNLCPIRCVVRRLAMKYALWSTRLLLFYGFRVPQIVKLKLNNTMKSDSFVYLLCGQGIRCTSVFHFERMELWHQKFEGKLCVPKYKAVLKRLAWFCFATASIFEGNLLSMKLK